MSKYKVYSYSNSEYYNDIHLFPRKLELWGGEIECIKYHDKYKHPCKLEYTYCRETKSIIVNSIYMEELVDSVGKTLNDVVDILEGLFIELKIRCQLTNMKRNWLMTPNQCDIKTILVKAKYNSSDYEFYFEQFKND
jgi:hypothetical protein